MPTKISVPNMTELKDLPWKTVSVTSLITAIPIALGLNTWYVGWHDGRYAKKAEVITLAAATTMEETVARAQQTADSNSQKLDMLSIQLSSIKVQGAVTVAGALQSEYDRLLRDEKDTVEWREKRDKLKRQVALAIEYRDCLMQNMINCEVLRGW